MCVLQFVEGLTDRQATESVRTRIDWKYLLCLELTDSGFDHTVLSEFRTRLIADVVTGKIDVREAATNLPEEPDETESLDEAQDLMDEDNALVDATGIAPEELE